MLIALYVWMTASRAFTPSHGSAEAWEALPENSKVPRTMPSRSWWSRVRSKPWIIMAQSTSRKTPPLISFTFPPPPSSAGVPMTWMRPFGSWARTAARAAPAPTPDVAITLCPQAWPMPGSASYSHRIAMVGPSPVSMVPRNAVSTPPTPFSTLKPWRARKSLSHPHAWTSWYPSSGWAWI